MATLHVDIVNAEEQLFSGEAEFVVLPGEAGELGILPRHAPLISRIRAGMVRLRVPGRSTEERFYVAGGLLEVQPNRVTVLADSAMRAQSLEEARKLLANRSVEEERHDRARALAIAKADAELMLLISRLSHRQHYDGSS